MNTDFISKPAVKVMKKHKKAVVGTGFISLVAALVVPYVESKINKGNQSERNQEVWMEMMDLKVDVALLKGRIGVATVGTNIPFATNISYTVYKQ